MVFKLLIKPLIIYLVSISLKDMEVLTISFKKRSGTKYS